MLHALAYVCLPDPFGDSLSLRALSDQQSPISMTVYLSGADPDLDTVPLLEVRLTPLAVESTALTQVDFEDAEQGEISGVVARASAPRLTEACTKTCDPSRFAKDTNLQPGQAVTLVITIDVAPDGSTASAAVVKGCGDLAIDAAAIRYARSLHWIPATKDGRQTAARVRFPVTLVGRI